jgi:hypothetical protein
MAGRAVERPAAPEGARQGRTRRSRGTRRDRARPPAALRFRGVAGCPRWKGSAEMQSSAAGEGFPLPSRLSGLKDIVALFPARDPHDLRHPSPARCTRDVNDQVDGLPNGPVRDALGHLADQILQPA